LFTTNHDPEKYYHDAIKDARVNHIDSKDSKQFYKKIFLTFNLVFLLLGAGYFLYTYLQQKDNFLKKTSVLGVSYTSDEENKKLEALLSQMDPDTIDEEDFNQDALKQIVNNSNANNSEYINSLKREIQPQKRDEVTITVHRGDTLRSLAIQYYGDPSAYRKILKDNPKINPRSKKIYEGESIKLYY